jgi:hypothetical protein
VLLPLLRFAAVLLARALSHRVSPLALSPCSGKNGHRLELDPDWQTGDRFVLAFQAYHCEPTQPPRAIAGAFYELKLDDAKYFVSHNDDQEPDRIEVPTAVLDRAISKSDPKIDSGF